MIHAFKQIRLTNTPMSGVNGRLMIGTESDAHMSDLTTASGILSASIAATGSALFGLISAASAGVGSINGASGALTLTGAGNVSVIMNGQSITISGNTGAYANFATNVNLTATGQTLFNNINAISGNVVATGQTLYNLVTAMSGQANLNYATIPNLTATGQTLLTFTNNNSNNLSGNLYLTGSNLYNMLKTFSGNSQSFVTGINPTGFDSYMVTYPLGAFTAVPRIYCTVEISGNVMYAVNITGRTTTNFWALFSDVISESGVQLHSFCTINQ